LLNNVEDDVEFELMKEYSQVAFGSAYKSDEFSFSFMNQKHVQLYYEKESGWRIELFS